MITDVLTAAGFADVAVSPMSFTVEVPEARLDEAVTASCAVGVARQVLDATAGADQRVAIRQAAHGTLAQKVSQGWLRLAAAAHVVTAARTP
ncbi:MAG: hypothetical protein R2746_14280 [Acidimicrobiales bacterium]